MLNTSETASELLKFAQVHERLARGLLGLQKVLDILKFVISINSSLCLTMEGKQVVQRYQKNRRDQNQHKTLWCIRYKVLDVIGGGINRKQSVRVP